MKMIKTKIHVKYFLKNEKKNEKSELTKLFEKKKKTKKITLIEW